MTTYVQRMEVPPVTFRRVRIWGVVVSASDHRKLSHDAVPQCRINGIQVLTEACFWEQEAYFIDTGAQNASSFLTTGGFRFDRAEQIRQRSTDAIIALGLLALTLPLMFIVAILIKRDSRGPVMYRQDRIGLRGRALTLPKFRSMRDDAEALGPPRWAEQADSHITRVGRFIRLTWIDELPQLLNVLRGDVGIIGPRPERPYFVSRLAEVVPHYNARHFVKRGITRWTQVKAPYDTSIEDARTKLRNDLYYVKHRSVRLDLSILLRTIKVIVLQKGAR